MSLLTLFLMGVPAMLAVSFFLPKETNITGRLS